MTSLNTLSLYWSDLPFSMELFSVEEVKSLPSSHFEWSFCKLNFGLIMASKRSKPHPDLPMVRLRPWVDDIDIPDIPDIQDFQIPPDFGK